MHKYILLEVFYMSNFTILHMQTNTKLRSTVINILGSKMFDIAVSDVKDSPENQNQNPENAQDDEVDNLCAPRQN